jgi:hypothetical protein
MKTRSAPLLSRGQNDFSKTAVIKPLCLKSLIAENQTRLRRPEISRHFLFLTSLPFACDNYHEFAFYNIIGKVCGYF